MKLIVFSVYDEKAKIFHQPFYFNQRGEAVRTFQDLVQDQKSVISKHPEDYKLYQLGTYDDNTGNIVSLPQPEFINHGSDFLCKV